MTEHPYTTHDRALEAKASPGPWDYREWGARPDDGPTNFAILHETGTLARTYGYSRFDQDVAALIVSRHNHAALVNDVIDAAAAVTHAVFDEPGYVALALSENLRAALDALAEAVRDA